MSGAALVLAAVVVLVSWRLPKVVLDRALKRGLIDIPNRRSSHTIPTPCGGGAALPSPSSEGSWWERCSISSPGTLRSRSVAAAIRWR